MSLHISKHIRNLSLSPMAIRYFSVLMNKIKSSFNKAQIMKDKLYNCFSYLFIVDLITQNTCYCEFSLFCFHDFALESCLGIPS